MMQDDPWEGLECDSVEYNEIDGFFDYITVHFVPKRPALALGTYTLVVKFRPTTSFTSNTVQALLASASTSVAELDTADTYTLTFTLQNLPTGASSVLFLPGIQASRLYTPGILGSEDQLWEANDNGDVRQLAMTATGESSTSVYTRDIVGEAYGALGVYAGFSAYMNTLVSDQTIKAWTPFAYDWRYSG
jgi:hypothetical protein